ncbi:MFS transporter [Desulfurispirillum indicum]|uniref:Major facilitator superfamily MFS_1 n=1 Tax=Desulfurispirillum indicum (strain ATCC BAA-1389 / DSM 22839 / S5) TaxID=653733 RepID=E6W210_DESIS|nr:MFS transporter [Desulfurispirillum indicum]ADU66636.1 major facilitator superfamily MFS_1 [Desulfurispirillum indicum S5]UCZ55953.1 MFS transporter [Desulfurispirillum indicum]
MTELRPLLIANALCVSAMMAFVAVVGPLVRALGLAEWHGGLAVTLAGVLWMLLARPWGRASDRYGRKPILLLSMGGFALAYLLLAVVLDIALYLSLGVVVTVTLLSLSRSLIGAFYAAVPPASAALIADRFPRETRTSAMASLGAANAIGMVLGPLLGGMLASWSLTLPLYMAAVLPLLAVVLLWRFLPATEPRSAASAAPPRLFDPRLRLPLASALLAMGTVVTAQTCIGFFALDRLNLDGASAARVAGSAMACVGVMLIAVQVAVMRFRSVAPEVWLTSGALVAATGFGAVTQVSASLGLIVSYGIAAAGMGLVFPAFQALAANAVSATEQGHAAGSVSAVQGLAIVIAPLASAALYGMNPTLPYGVCAVLLLVLALSGGLAMRRRFSG